MIIINSQAIKSLLFIVIYIVKYDVSDISCIFYSFSIYITLAGINNKENNVMCPCQNVYKNNIVQDVKRNLILLNFTYYSIFFWDFRKIFKP